MNKKVAIPIIIIVAVFMVGVGIVVSGVADDLIFDMIPYNYTSICSIPPYTSELGSLTGYYSIQGKGRDFTFQIKIPGAQKAYKDRGDTEFLAYTEDGLTGKGRIEYIDITYDTILSLISGDFKTAMLKTKFKGVLNYKCAGWTGNGNFTNDGKNFKGFFKINGDITYWEGTFKLIPDGNRIAMPAQYFLHPLGKPEQKKYVNKTFHI